MKLRNLFFLSAIALGSVACSESDDAGITTGDADAFVSIKVVPTSNNSGLRSVGDLTGALADESKITKLEVWVYNGDAEERYRAVTAPAGESVLEVDSIQASVGERTIVITANTNWGHQPSLTNFKKQIQTLSQDITNGLPMSAEPFPVNLEEGHNYYGFTSTELSGRPTGNDLSIGAPVKLRRVNARVALVEAKVDVTKTPAGQRVAIDSLGKVEVAIFNVPSSVLFGETLDQTDAYFYGGEDWAGEDYMNSSNKGSYEATLGEKEFEFPVTKAKAPYFYVNENHGTEANGQMLLIVRGIPYLKGVQVNEPGLITNPEDGYTYYAIKINGNDPEHEYTYVGENTGDGKVRRNTQYNISLTMSGSGGTATIDPLKNAFLDVKVEVEPWAVVDQDVIW